VGSIPTSPAFIIRKPPLGGFRALARELAFFVRRALFALLAELRILQLALHLFLVLRGEVIRALALRALHADKVIL
jgi:hypothetical protein